MAKSKAGSVPNRHIYSRISYLYQAATYLESHNTKQSPAHSSPTADDETGQLGGQELPPTAQASQTLSRRLLTDLRTTSLKSQIRLSRAMKHTICKFCDSLLVEGETSTSTVENTSKGGKKPWADVLVVKCNSCERAKRYPVGAPRQKRRPVRPTREQESDEKAPTLPKDDVDVVMEEG
ncbi:Uu.00g116130.m01.CDS01 [Anthostomella pinea]|uniref:Uu.00g116130.m01.CDS01 n=1 Tax=Anthostomella pinea TaxID=933095 RepID=A0AAI8VFY3_9PEZI|nr:Uu.00g116130.m01.CDS01 [Anthostomella pinea]